MTPLSNEHIDDIVSNILVKSFWSIEHKIFDIEFYHKNELLVMFSYPNDQEWQQHGSMMTNWYPRFYSDNIEDYIHKKNLLELLMSKLHDIASNLWKKRNVKS